MTNFGGLTGTKSWAEAINDNGQVVGSSYTSYPQAFFYSNGNMINLPTLPGKLDGYAVGINGSGQVLGYDWTSTSPQEIFLYSNGSMTSLDSLSTATSTAINNNGQIVGAAGDSAFLYSNGISQLGVARFW